MLTRLFSSGATLLTTAMLFAPVLTFANVGVKLEASQSADTDAGSAIDSDLMLNASTMSTGTELDAEVEAETSSKVSSEIFVGMALNAEGEAITDAEDVRSEDDLAIFATNINMMNDKVEKVTIDSTKKDQTVVSVNYLHSGRLFGLLPVNVRSTTIVAMQNDGSLEITHKLPWWSGAVRGIEHSRANIENALSSNSTIRGSIEAGFSAKSKALVTKAIVTELDAQSQMYAVVE